MGKQADLKLFTFLNMYHPEYKFNFLYIFAPRDTHYKVHCSGYCYIRGAGGRIQICVRGAMR